MVCMLVRQFIVGPFFHWLSQSDHCGCIKRNDRLFAITFKSSTNIWTRFALMTWFEFLIACLTGLDLENKIPGEL